jgi:hypothetical protein
MLYDDARGYSEVMRHHGHNITIVNYPVAYEFDTASNVCSLPDVNVTIECMNCNEVIVDYTKEINNA